MPKVEGKIEEITVTDILCCVRVKKTDGTETNVLLWAYSTQEDNAKNRLTHGVYLSLSRDAFVHNKTITYNHPNGNALVTNVKISP